MRLPAPSARYDSTNEAQTRREIERADAFNLKRGTQIETSITPLILVSPDGSRFSLTVDNAGVLAATPL